MENETTENETPTNEEVVEETITEEEETPETTSEEIDELKKKADLADNYKIRAEKAEKKLKESPKVETEGLATKDIVALTKVHEDDYDEVIKAAKLLGKPVSEALKDSTLKAIIAVRAEERTTANATNTKANARGGSKVDGESLLEKAETSGEVPDTAEGMKKLAEARIARAKARTK